MFEFLSQNIGTIIISLVLIGIVSIIIIKLVKDKKQGKSTCSCGCKDCANSGMCHNDKH